MIHTLLRDHSRGGSTEERCAVASLRELFQDFSRLHRPENQIELIEIYTDVPSETNKLLLNFEILPSG